MKLLLLLALAQHLDFASVTLSNGEKTQGVFSMQEGRKVEIYDIAKDRRFRLDPAEIVRIAVIVEEEKLQQGWMFKEEGNDEKLKLPYTYPLRKLISEITIVSGETLRGHATGVFYIEGEEGDPARYILMANQKGEKNQKLDDLIYIKDVVLPNRKAGDGKLGTIELAGDAAIVSVEREISFQPPFAGMLKGHYDAFVFKGNKIRFGLTGKPPTDAELKGIDDKIQITEEFFTKKKIVAAEKDGNVARVFIELSRTEETVDKGFKYARWEYWTFEPTAKTWDIRKRLFLHRERYNGDLPAFEYAPDEKLKSVTENAKLN